MKGITDVLALSLSLFCAAATLSAQTKVAYTDGSYTLHYDAAELGSVVVTVVVKDGVLFSVILPEGKGDVELEDADLAPFLAAIVAAPDYMKVDAVSGASMPHFAGWPGTPGYNVTNHETEKVEGLSPNTIESTAADVAAWKSKRERGDSYGMNAKNDWWKQMDFYQGIFIGKTVDEVEAWFATYGNDANGRPLNPESRGSGRRRSDLRGRSAAHGPRRLAENGSDGHERLRYTGVARALKRAPCPSNSQVRLPHVLVLGHLGGLA
jgi:hypothetical protein